MSVCLFMINEPIYFSYTYVPQREHVIDIYLFHKSGFSNYELTFLSQLLPYFCGKPFTNVDAWIQRVMISALRSCSHVSEAHLVSRSCPFNFNPLHFKHRFNWSTVYSFRSLPNFDPGTPSSSVRTVNDCRALLAIRIIFPHFSYKIELCLSESRGGLKFRDVISAKRYRA